MAIAFFETAMRLAVDADSRCNEAILSQQTENWMEKTAGFDASDMAADGIERSEQFKFHIAANLASANVVPAWMNDLGAYARGEKSFSPPI